MIVVWSRASFTGSGAGSRGGMFRLRSGRGRRCGSDTAVIAATALGNGYWRPCWRTRRVWWIGRSRSTRRSIVLTSTRRTFRASQGDLSNYTNLRVEPPDHGIGRSRGGLSTKIHALVDGNGRPLVLLTGPSQANDSPKFSHLLGQLRIDRLGPGRPRTRPERVRGARAY